MKALEKLLTTLRWHLAGLRYTYGFTPFPPLGGMKEPTCK